MAGPIKLSKPYDSRDDAAMGGFRRVLLNNNQWESQEFGFWVIMKVCPDEKDKKAVKYFYTEPEGGNRGGVKLPLPQGVMVRAHCHTHPKSISSGDFGSDDKASFHDLQEIRPGTAFYLMNPFQEIRRAITEGEFLAGVTVNWNSKVTP